MTALISGEARLSNRFGVILAATLLVFAIAKSVPSYAAGVGAAEVESALGDHLSVTIPIFNINNPDSLILTVDSDMFGGDPNKQLRAELLRRNSQLAVRVFTDWPVMEPYISFALELQDGAVKQNKDFVLLLEFQPSLGASDPLRVRQADTASGAAPQPVISLLEQSSTAESSSQTKNSVMGPYDWAQSGSIPESFGAVLDGQSLWRVARRINKAMGVSVEQMMVALYDANPDAFYNSSIDSLKAGSYLRIPDEAQVTSLSSAAAKARVDELATLQTARVVETSPVAEATVIAEPAEQLPQPADESQIETATEKPDPIVNEQSEPVANANGPLFAIGESRELAEAEARLLNDVRQSSEGAAQTLESTQTQASIIDSLSKTIGDLMRDNVDKEQRLQEMDSRLKALETTLDNLDLVAQSDLASTAQQSEPAGDSRWWLWLIPLVAGIGIWIGLRAWHQLSSPQKKLFTAADEEPAEQHSIHIEGQEPYTPKVDDFMRDTDFSVMRSHKSRNPDEQEGDVEGVTFQEFDDELGDPEMDIEPPVAEHTIEFDTSNVATFPGRPKRNLLEAIDSFIEERDFAAARDALDGARGKELDEPNYHFQRLRILLEKNDEHGFYEYFNLVENKFADVDRDLKLDLANLVSRLNQQS